MAKWRASPALREVYGDIFIELGRHLGDGSTLELGSGIGVIKEFFPGVVTSDVVKTKFVDLAVSAYDIPLNDQRSWQNIVAFDVLHHLREPFRFFSSAASALTAGGRIILMEPAGTPGGCVFYRLFHHESCDPKKIAPPFDFREENIGGDFANMGMGLSLFKLWFPETENRLSGLRLKMTHLSYRDFLAYPATGGFSKRALLPTSLIRLILRIERIMPKSFFRIFGLRMVVVLEKS